MTAKSTTPRNLETPDSSDVRGIGDTGDIDLESLQAELKVLEKKNNDIYSEHGTLTEAPRGVQVVIDPKHQAEADSVQADIKEVKEMMKHFKKPKETTQSTEKPNYKTPSETGTLITRKAKKRASGQEVVSINLDEVQKEIERRRKQRSKAPDKGKTVIVDMDEYRKKKK